MGDDEIVVEEEAVVLSIVAVASLTEEVTCKLYLHVRSMEYGRVF